MSDSALVILGLGVGVLVVLFIVYLLWPKDKRRGTSYGPGDMFIFFSGDDDCGGGDCGGDGGCD